MEAASSAPGEDVRYSDLGFMLLGWVLEACLGRSLEDAFAAEVAAPLGLRHTQFRPSSADRRRTAATELNGDQRPRPGLVWGEVHDGNAHALGGVAGHAGLFAPLGDMARFVQALLDPEPGTLLSAESIALMGTRQASTGADVRGIGWRLEPENWGSWPPGTIWHTGFTGTSLLVAPARGTAVVLLTNSVHPYRRLDDQAAGAGRNPPAGGRGVPVTLPDASPPAGALALRGAPRRRASPRRPSPGRRSSAAFRPRRYARGSLTWTYSARPNWSP